MEWVSEQFLNGTSAHIMLFSALPWHGGFTVKMNNEYIVKSKRENNDNKNMNMKGKSEYKI